MLKENTLDELNKIKHEILNSANALNLIFKLIN